jgi:hypothetical protein
MWRFCTEDAILFMKTDGWNDGTCVRYALAHKKLRDEQRIVMRNLPEWMKSGDVTWLWNIQHNY